MIKRIATVLPLLLLPLTLLRADEAPSPELVPSAEFHPRDGIGNVLAKLNRGREVRIAYFGGSITAANGWRPKTLRWFQQTWPQARITEINAAIGGTGSDLGVYRNAQDVLRHKPDLVFVEFAVNDSGATPQNIWRGMEGIVRQTWRADASTDIVFVYTFMAGQETDLDRGLFPRAASAMERLADHYGIPSIGVSHRIHQLFRENRLWIVPRKDSDGRPLATPPDVILFSNDGVHPLDAAHQIYADVVGAAIRGLEPTARPRHHSLRRPLQQDNWERARIVPVHPSMLTGEWRQLDGSSPLRGFFSYLPATWEATQPGARIAFRFKGTAVKLYDLVGPDGAQVRITLDGKSWTAARFDRYCTYHRLATLGIADGLAPREHSVTVEILAEQPDRSVVTNEERKRPGFDPHKYDGTAVRVGGILVIGDVRLRERVPTSPAMPHAGEAVPDRAARVR